MCEGIVITTFLSERRKSGRRRTHTTSDVALLDQSRPDCGESISDRDEVRRLLATLPVKQRTAIVPPLSS
jgi:DNA-directed RNA polymerase specialized sigma24 family protein